MLGQLYDIKVQKEKLTKRQQLVSGNHLLLQILCGASYESSPHTIETSGLNFYPETLVPEIGFLEN